MSNRRCSRGGLPNKIACAIAISLAASLISNEACTAQDDALVDAVWSEIPLEVLVDRSETIVRGVVAETAGAKDAGQKVQAAVVRVDEVLKGEKQPEKNTVRVTASDGISGSAAIPFTKDLAGVWLLDRDPGEDTFQLDHPSQFVPAEQVDQIREVIKARRDQPKGVPVGGLAVRLELLTDPDSSDDESGGSDLMFLRCSVVNTSDKVIRLRNRPIAEVVSVVVEGGGSERRVDLFPGLGRIGGPSPEPVELTPGSIKFIGPIAVGTGIVILLRGEPEAGADSVSGIGPRDERVFCVMQFPEEEGFWSGRAVSNRVAIPAER